MTSSSSCSSFLKRPFLFSKMFFLVVALLCLLLFVLLLLVPQGRDIHFLKYSIDSGLNRTKNAISKEFFANGMERGKDAAALNECRLPRIDPWDPTIEKYVNPKYGELARHYRDCVRQYPEISLLREGKVWTNTTLLKEGNICEFRCLYPQTDYKLTFGQWSGIGEKPDCDVVEVQCKTSAKNDSSAVVFYNYLHTQIYDPRGGQKKEQQPQKSDLDVEVEPISVEEEEKEQKEGVEEKATGSAPSNSNWPPDVHVLVIDSVSHTMFLRSLPKTTMWLRERMDAIPFPHLNKVGLNSQPNGFAMFFGFQVTPITENPMGDPYTPDRSLDILNWVYLDHEPFIGFEYRAKNYRTMMAEDWAKGTFNWPNHYGFNRPPTEHYMRPFHLRTENMDDKNGTLTANLYKKSCKDVHHYVLDYLGQFVEAYEDEPKFSITWYAGAAHNSVNGAFWIDEDFYNFLRIYEKKLENSFLIITADHGLRFSGVRDTPEGEVEDNNPALFLVLPRHLRRNRRLVENLRENSRHLVTHFDTHATLLHIAREGASWTKNSSSFDARKTPELLQLAPFGSSLLERFDPSQPRHCGTLHVPFDYCLCQFHKVDQTAVEAELAVDLAQIMVDKMNLELQKQNASSLCAPLALNRTMTVEILEFEPEKQVNVFQVTYHTIPGNGHFWGYIRLDNRKAPSDGHALITSKFPRLDAYGEQAKCIDKEKHELASYCYCRELLPKTTMTSGNTTTTP